MLLVAISFIVIVLTRVFYGGMFGQGGALKVPGGGAPGPDAAQEDELEVGECEARVGYPNLYSAVDEVGSGK